MAVNATINNVSVFGNIITSIELRSIILTVFFSE